MIKFSIKDSNKMDPMAILDKFSKVTSNYEFFRLSDFLDSLLRTWMILDRFSIMYLPDEMFSTGLQKLESRFPPEPIRCSFLCC